MVRFASLIAAALLAGCTAQQPDPAAATRADTRFAEAVRGRTPGEPQNCISTLGLQGPQQISPTRLIYQTGASQVWVNQLDAPCTGVDDLNTIVVVRQFNGTQLCRGDTFETIDRTGGFPRSGICRFGRFTPYTKPKAR